MRELHCDLISFEMEKIITDLIKKIRKNSKRPYSESIWNNCKRMVTNSTSIQLLKLYEQCSTSGVTETARAFGDFSVRGPQLRAYVK